MHITTVRLRNWCQHSSLDVDLRAGLNGILGSNGKGKSNLLDAMRFAVTGESINPGGKKDNLMWGQEKGWVELTFIAGDTEYTIRRAIETPKVSLKFGDTVISKQAETEEFLVRLLGANMRTILDNVFIPQGKIDSILFARASDRLKEFQQTFGLEQAAEAHKWLSQEANAYQVTSGLDEQLQAAVQSVFQARTEIESITGQIAARKAEIATLEPAEQVINRALEATRTGEAIRQADQEIAGATAEETHHGRATIGTDEILTSIRESLEPLKPQAELTKLKITQLEQAIMQYGQAESLRGQLSAAERDLAKLEKPADQQVLANMRQQVAHLQVEVEQSKAVMEGRAALPVLPAERALQDESSRLSVELAPRESSSYALSAPEFIKLELEHKQTENHLLAAKAGRCPTCDQEFAGHYPSLEKKSLEEINQLNDLADRLCDEYKAKTDQIKARLSEIDASLTQFKAIGLQVVGRQLDAKRAELATLQGNLDQAFRTATAHEALARSRDLLAAQLQGAPEQKPDEAPLAALRDFLGRFDQMVKEETEAAKESAWAVERLKNARTRKAQALSIREKLGASVDMPTPQEIETAKLQAVSLGLARTALSELGQNLGVARALGEQREAEVTRLRETLNRESKDAAWVAEVRKARDVLHVTNLPALMMREYARLLNVRIEHYLSVWESPFRMWLADDMSFRVKFDDGKELDAARLSGGQKIVASASFRLAMSDTFARTVGLLVFDEPSTYLDKENIQHLQTLLLKLKEMSQHSGRQILVVTHEESLMGFLDHVITV